MDTVSEVKLPDPEVQIAVDLIDGFRASKAAFVALSLGVFDQLHEGAATCQALAAALRCEPDALERLLGACVALRLLNLNNGVYENRSVATRFLRVASPETFSGYILYSDRVLFRLWSQLEDAVREGSNRWEQVFGKKEGIFDHFFSSDEDKAIFLAGMHGLGCISSPAVISAFDLSRFGHFVDVGGGTGHLAIEACRRYPALQSTVFDLQTVVPVAQSYVAAAGFEARVAVTGGDFFTDSLPPADLYALARVLHDWSDEKVAYLVRKIYAALPKAGGLLICEKILNENRDGPAGAYLQSLNMLVCTEGKERTATEYENLVKSAGFSRFEYRKTGRPVDAMLAIK